MPNLNIVRHLQKEVKLFRDFGTTQGLLTLLFILHKHFKCSCSLLYSYRINEMRPICITVYMLDKTNLS